MENRNVFQGGLRVENTSYDILPMSVIAWRLFMITFQGPTHRCHGHFLSEHEWMLTLKFSKNKPAIRRYMDPDWVVIWRGRMILEPQAWKRLMDMRKDGCNSH
jgi:hypothetical protein